MGSGQLQALPSDVTGVIVCSSWSTIPQEPKGLSGLEEGVNIQHCGSGVCISREISVRASVQKAEMGKNRLLPTGFLAKVNNKK